MRRRVAETRLEDLAKIAVVGYRRDMATFQDLVTRAERIGAILKDRKETVCVAESSTGGLISAALLGVAGASAYFIGGAVVYTLKARRDLLGIADGSFKGVRGLTEEGAILFARAARERLGVNWAISEIGAAGPTGSRYGDPAGHSCIAVTGAAEKATTVDTGSPDRVANMYAFAAAALDLFAQCLGK
ncbi:MAG TPA: CinA family protein [Candidatus Binataceae bacterium]|nr:CinA family protein [Candidatus Binataceae bacterium]